MHRSLTKYLCVSSQLKAQGTAQCTVQFKRILSNTTILLICMREQALFCTFVYI